MRGLTFLKKIGINKFIPISLENGKSIYLHKLLNQFARANEPKTKDIVKRNKWGKIKETFTGRPCNLCKYKNRPKDNPCSCCYAILKSNEYYI